MINLPFAIINQVLDQRFYVRYPNKNNYIKI